MDFKKSLVSLVVAGVVSSAYAFPPPDITTDSRSLSAVDSYIDRVFDEFFHIKPRIIHKLKYPLMDRFESKKDYRFELLVAGMKKGDIKVDLEGNFLIISGKKEQYKKDKQKDLISQESFYGEFKRVIKLPQNANKEKIEVKYQDGVLKVTIEKKKVTKPRSRSIPIN
jgi:HSP20 family protein